MGYIILRIIRNQSIENTLEHAISIFYLGHNWGVQHKLQGIPKIISLMSVSEQTQLKRLAKSERQTSKML